MSAGDWQTVGADGEPVSQAWSFKREGQAWNDEAWTRYMLTPHKIEMVDGKLLGCDEDRELLLGLLLENVGADRAVCFGNPDVWRAAVAVASSARATRA